MMFTPRLTRPVAGNKYYIRKASGGYSNAITGSPKDSQCDVLSNCVGYAYGRFNEIGNYGYCKYLAPVNAENFIQYKGSCTVGQTPKLGACMVWQKGASLSGSDGAGHVAIVEKIISDTEVITSESGYGCKTPFWTQTRKKGSDGRWGCGSSYKFLGFIYNPAVADSESIIPVTPSTTFKKGDLVKLASDATYYTGKKIPAWVKKQCWYISEVKGDRAVIDKSEDGKSSICSPINVKYLSLAKSAAPAQETFKPYLVKVNTSALNIRKGAGTNYAKIGCITDKGVYTIVAESDGQGASKWGKLKSGAGWIALDYCIKR